MGRSEYKKRKRCGYLLEVEIDGRRVTVVARHIHSFKWSNSTDSGQEGIKKKKDAAVCLGEDNRLLTSFIF